MDGDNITKIITALISLFGVVLGAVLGYISRSKKFGEIEISLATIKKDIEYIRKETHGKGKEK